MVVVESAVTSIYICYAEDPSLIHRWDAEFFNQMTETLHQRLQHRSARAREVLSHGGLDARFEETVPKLNSRSSCEAEAVSSLQWEGRIWVLNTPS
ncbi:hypothetical protein CsSME_00022347 [Camellia sinensis var. sinensis]